MVPFSYSKMMLATGFWLKSSKISLAPLRGEVAIRQMMQENDENMPNKAK